MASWHYNPFIGWYTPLPRESFNDLVEPQPIEISLLIHLIFGGILIGAVYGVSFKDLESVDESRKAKKFAFVNLFLLVLNGFYVAVFPLMYFIPNGFLFPFAIKTDIDLSFTYHYSVGIGYLLQVIGFIACFPYSAFYYQTIMRFEMDARSPQKVIQDYIEDVKEPLDLDRYIAEERIKLRFSEKDDPDVAEYLKKLKEEEGSR